MPGQLALRKDVLSRSDELPAMPAVESDLLQVLSPRAAARWQEGCEKKGKQDALAQLRSLQRRRARSPVDVNDRSKTCARPRI